MRALDTNVLIRFIAGDDPEQSSRARKAILEGGLFISLTVILETEWVLRSAYRYPPARIGHALRMVAGLDKVTIERGAVLAVALHWFENGMDFADALHLASAEDCTAFLTFDRKLARFAEGRSPIAIVEP